MSIWYINTRNLKSIEIYIIGVEYGEDAQTDVSSFLPKCFKVMTTAILSCPPRVFSFLNFIIRKSTFSPICQTFVNLLPLATDNLPEAKQLPYISISISNYKRARNAISKIIRFSHPSLLKKSDDDAPYYGTPVYTIF